MCWITICLNDFVNVKTEFFKSPFSFLKWTQRKIKILLGYISCEMDRSGFEPEASALQGRRYTRFNYRPINLSVSMKESSPALVNSNFIFSKKKK